MDVSKLPKLSDTQQEQRAQAAAANPTEPSDAISTAAREAPTDMRRDDATPPMAGGADVWISIAVGTILLLMFPRFLKWLSWRTFGTHFDQFIAPDGAIVPYTQVSEFWGDLGPTLFGAVLIVEGISLMFARRRGVMIFAFGLTVIATVYNLIYLVMSYNTYGLALVSAFAVAFGVYIAMYQWNLIKMMSPRSVSPI